MQYNGMEYNPNMCYRATDSMKNAQGATTGYTLMSDSGQVVQMTNKEIKEALMTGQIQIVYNLEITKDNKLIHIEKYDYTGLSVPFDRWCNRVLNDDWTIESAIGIPNRLICRRRDSKGFLLLDMRDLKKNTDVASLQQAKYIKVTLVKQSLTHPEYQGIQIPKDFMEYAVCRIDNKGDQYFIKFLERIHNSKLGRMLEVANQHAPIRLQQEERKAFNQEQQALVSELSTTEESKVIHKKADNFLMSGLLGKRRKA